MVIITFETNAETTGSGYIHREASYRNLGIELSTGPHAGGKWHLHVYGLKDRENWASFPMLSFAFHFGSDTADFDSEQSAIDFVGNHIEAMSATYDQIFDALQALRDAAKKG